MSKIFSQATLAEFEAASASIPLRQLVRAFEGAGLRLGADPGGPDGARRVQFRRYVASVDQQDPGQVQRLGDVLGALIDEVATAKQSFLVSAAERDGFVFAAGIFRPAASDSSSFTVTRIEDLAHVDERARRLHLIARDHPRDAIAGARALVESVCRTVLHASGDAAPAKKAGLAAIVGSTLAAIERARAGDDDAQATAVVRRCLEQFVEVVERIGALQGAPSPPRALVAVGAAVTFATFVADTYTERTAARL